MYILKQRHPIYGIPGYQYSDTEFNQVVPDHHKKYFEYEDGTDSNDGNFGEYISSEEFDYRLEEE